MSKKNKADPTGQAANRNRGSRNLVKRLVRAEREVKALFRSIPRSVRRQTSIVNAEQKTIYSYEYNQEDFDRVTQFIINRELLETQSGSMPFNWYWQEDIELPYRQGTAEEVRDFNQLIAGAVAAGVVVRGLPPQAVPIEQVLLSDGYRKRLSDVYVTNFTTVKGLSDRVAAQVLQRINAGVKAGETPTFIANDISSRFDVAKSSAKRISETEINKAYNDAKLDATRLLGEQTGLRAAVIHISALTSTTRATHAARHGNAYTVADQLSWWNAGANRIQCKCTTESVLIDKAGKVIDNELQEEIKSERAFFS